MNDLENKLGDFSLEDMFDVNVFCSEKDEPLWDKLIQQIIDGKVIPVIGADLLIENSQNLHKLIIDFLAKGFHVNSCPNSFSELIYDPDYTKVNKKDNVYYQVNKVFANKRFSPSPR